jgi:hypothetical protein
MKKKILAVIAALLLTASTMNVNAYNVEVNLSCGGPAIHVRVLENESILDFLNYIWWLDGVLCQDTDFYGNPIP